jgi:predicted acylesterase/phospholipase RssA
MIEHIVINGGGPTGLISYGALKYLFEQEFIKIDNIKTIYGTSVGAIVGVMLSLRYDWVTLDDYFIKRPWDRVFKIEPDNLFEMYYSKGLFQFSIVREILKPLLSAKDLSENITLNEYYEYTKIDHHFFTVELNSCEKIDLNHKTYPELSLLTALEMSCAVPVLCKPIIIDNKCYVDGGLFDNYPINECIKNEKCDEDTILGIRNKWTFDDTVISDSMNLFQYLQVSLEKIVKHIQKDNISKVIRYEVKCLCDEKISEISNWIVYMTDREKRVELIKTGKNYAELFFNYEQELSQRTI